MNTFAMIHGALLLALLHGDVPDADLVASAFPSDLVEADGQRQSAFVAADLNRDGHPLLLRSTATAGELPFVY